MQTYIKYPEFYVGLYKNKTHSSIKMSVNLPALYSIGIVYTQLEFSYY